MSKGGGAQGPTQQNVTTTSLPEEFRPYLDRALSRGEALSNRPYEAYTGRRLADFSGDTQASFAGTRANQGVWSPSNTAAMGGTQGAMDSTGAIGRGTWDTATAQQYMDPYLGTVLDQQRIRQQQAFDQQTNSNDMNATKSGAFGGSRHGVMQAIAQRAMNQQVNEREAGALSNAYNTAHTAWSGDQDRGLAAADQIGRLSSGLAALGQQRSDLGYADAEAMRNMGLTQEQMEQAGIDINYTDFTNQRDYDRQNLSFMSGLINGSPLGSSSDVTTTQFQNPYAQALGLGLGLYGAGQNAGGRR